MSYRIQQDSVPDAVRRITAEQIDHALDGLTGSRRIDEGVHRARRCCKKIRAVLRLVRSSHTKTFRRENRAFRDIGRLLAHSRDTAVALSTFLRLAQSQEARSSTKPIAAVGKGLEQDHADHQPMAREQIDTAIERLRAARERIPAWQFTDDGFAAIADGLSDVYRRGRTAYRAVGDTPTPEILHELRKQVKYLWYHTRLLRSLWPGPLKLQAAILNHLGESLGAHHDLAMLSERLLADPDRYGGSRAVRSVTALAEQRQAAIVSTAVDICARVYAEQPRCYLRRMEQYWQVWRGTAG